MAKGAAFIYAALSGGVMIFQLCLAAGMPWGSYAMGGAFAGEFPPAMRVAAVIQALIIFAFAAVVLSRAQLGFSKLRKISQKLIWFVVAFGIVGFILNVITPSQGERLLWAPVAFVLLISSVVVARSDSRA